MTRSALFVGAGALVSTPIACAAGSPTGAASPAPAAGSSASGAQGNSPSAPGDAAQNPLLPKWSGPYGGVPPFSKARLEHFAPAYAAAMDEQRREIAAIANDASAPTFENTILAMEDSGRMFARVSTVFDVWSSTLKNAEFQSIERELAPKLAAFSDEIIQNEKLFKRIEAVYVSAELAKLSPEQKRLARRYHLNFVRAGAKLDSVAKKQLSDLNQRLASLYTTFAQNLLSDEETYAVFIERAADLDGLPDSIREAAAAAAERRGQKGKWAIENTRSSVEPFLTYANSAALREQVWKNFVNRGDNADARDNNKLIAEILKLRAERAKLLGYRTHAHWRVEDSMAETPEQAMQLMEAVWKPAVQRVREEVRDMQAIADKQVPKRKITPWDYRYFAEKVRKAKYDVDQNDVKPYLQLDKLRDAMFWVAGELFGLSFTPLTNIEVYHPDVSVWEVKDAASGKHVGLWYFDPYARPGKTSGAWMNAYRNQEKFRGEVSTIVSNNANFVKGKPGESVLISWDDARTLFHEFGHALHGLCSNVNYPTLSGTSVPRDYVEFPSQLLEHWLTTPEVLNRFAVHFQTGAPIPGDLVQKLHKAKTFNQGFGTVEYLSSALIDMKLHLAEAQSIDPDAFEKETLKALGMPEEIVMRHRTPQFAHIFAGDGYSAGYYSYLWADTLSSDAYEAFTEASGPYDQGVAKRLREHVFSAGDTVDPKQAYRAFRGRDAGIGALMRERGFGR